MDNLKLEKKILIDGRIKLLTGMHIGGTDIGLAIGGADKIVVRNSFDNKPYIPGSSIKGKMRSLIEKIEGKVKIINKKKHNETIYEGGICTNEEEDLVQFFGLPAGEDTKYEFSAPTRLKVRDAMLNDESFKKLENSDVTDMYLTEIKSENNIDRLTSAANPRSFERVPAGTVFDFQFVFDIYNNDVIEDTKKDDKTREDRFIRMLKQGMDLIEMDYIGGHGSRGYGRVKFIVDDVKVKTSEDYKQNTSWQSDSLLKEKFPFKENE